MFLCRAGAAVGAPVTANAGGIVAAGGAALSPGAGAIASAASSFFGSVSGAGDDAASAATSGGPRPHNSTGTRPKRKVILVLQILQLLPPYVVVDIGCRSWLGFVPLLKLPQVVYLMICFQGMLDPGKELCYMLSF